MHFNQLTISLISIVTGSIITLLVKHLELFGQTTLIYKKIDAHYRLTGNCKYLIWIILDIQIKNTSGKESMITDFSCKYFSDLESKEFTIEKHKLPPGFTIDRKKIFTQQYKMVLSNGTNVKIPDDLSNVYFTITFKQGRIMKKNKVLLKDITWKEIKLPFLA